MVYVCVYFDGVATLSSRTETFESAREEFCMCVEFKVWYDGDRSYFVMCDFD